MTTTSPKDAFAASCAELLGAAMKLPRPCPPDRGPAADNAAVARPAGMISLRQTPQTASRPEVSNPQAVGLRPVFTMSGARSDRFHYRSMDKRIIDFSVIDDTRFARHFESLWNDRREPLVYGFSEGMT